jgi:hypothetical protein
MRLNLCPRRPLRSAGGFTLLEAVMVAGLVLLTITAVTLCVVNVSRAGVRFEQGMDGDRAAWRVAERLRALPFCAGSYPQARTPAGDPASDVVVAVFPHADSARNTASARYAPVAGDGESAGSFVTLFIEDGVQVECVARFRAGPDGPELGPEILSGWDSGSASAPPSGTLSVTLGVPGGGRRTSFVRSALLKPLLSVQATAAP